MPPYFQGKLDIQPCEKANSVPAEAEAQANTLLQVLTQSPDAKQLETMVRIAVAKAFGQQAVEVPAGSSVTATVTPFLCASQLPAATFEALALAIVQHRPRSALIELLGDEANLIMSLVDQPQRWPIGFFATSEELTAPDGSATQQQVVPYVASACVLDCCLHLPPECQEALRGPQAQRWHRERPGRLLVGPHTVWRPLASDHQLDEGTRTMITEHPDCLVITAFTTDKASSYLVAEPFL